MKINTNNIFKKFKNNKYLFIPIIIITALLGIYLGISVFFINHFTFGTYINDIKVSGSSVEEVKEELTQKAKSYSLEIKGRDNNIEIIDGNKIALEYVSSGKVDKLLEEQNPFGWIITVFKNKYYDVGRDFKFNEESLKEVVNNLECVIKPDLVAPKSASIKYNGDSFEIEDEVLGNTLNKEKTYEVISEAVSTGEEGVDLDSKGCYENPKYTKDSKEVKEALNTANSYLKAKVTYEFGDITDTVDKDTINQWISIDDNYNISINESAVRIYVDKLSGKFNTYGNSRRFKTSNNNTITITKGDYGWIVDKTKEIKELSEIVKNGQTITKEPVFSQKGKVYSKTDDYGNSYVEVDLASQHLWLYKDGNMILDTDIVSGTMSDPECVTPDGIYYIKYKELNATLRGEDYETKVSYWMPFNGGIGLHDATWRDTFGGDIYKYAGSHGCINLPPDKAAKIYENISAGTPVICYYDYDAAAKRSSKVTE